ncbi:hypothetical protein [Streptantibioticus cattleyicolor]|uniref:Uncharacterized protein n=1 Tax=Streptantibioticus cattleyicolor (strain ATCC 35852 / DSM 46488 / JCM 4925 / NBRC 14057 / NRRL 8057) TaxID=1003195 RepID=F8JK57_STREN|nr:hypothetical protein [Streptantibioticus cattleyicolor]AEW99801.1 hypothetical protein SCATT_p16080 [Streptantibioticus cattleyicolor NRRL 8057 = DSM 46488]CCB71159.1 protein of unknown function [Streptantibioticus cattleyicolor NRRL 8057 = DSM 46488]
MADPYFRIADAAIACAFQDDGEGIAALLEPLTPVEVKKVVGRLAVRTAEAMTEWGEQAGLTREQCCGVWQAALLRGQLLDEQA